MTDCINFGGVMISKEEWARTVKSTGDIAAECKMNEYIELFHRISRDLADGDYIAATDVRRYNHLLREISGNRIGEDPEMKEEACTKN